MMTRWTTITSALLALALVSLTGHDALAEWPGSANIGCTPYFVFNGGNDGFYIQDRDGEKSTDGLWNGSEGMNEGLAVGQVGGSSWDAVQGALVLEPGVHRVLRDGPLPAAAPWGQMPANYSEFCIATRVVGAAPDAPLPRIQITVTNANPGDAVGCVGECSIIHYPAKPVCDSGTDPLDPAWRWVAWDQRQVSGPNCELDPQIIIEVSHTSGTVYLDYLGLRDIPEATANHCMCASHQDCVALGVLGGQNSPCLNHACVDGLCVTTATPGCCDSAQDCNDGNPCTVDACAVPPGTGCAHEPVGEGCCRNDAECDDGVACTADDCNDHTHTCLHTPQTAVCGGGVGCNAQLCAPEVDGANPATGCVAAPASCDDGNVCTTDGCDAVTGGCTHDPIACVGAKDDCMVHSCDPDDGCQESPNHSHCPSDSCHIGQCQPDNLFEADPLTGCVQVPTDCDDGLPCTADSCDTEAGGCVHTTAGGSCDDGASCTTDSCNAAGTCTHTPVDLRCQGQDDLCAPVCEPDGDGAIAGTGCRDPAGTCDDGLACTTDACEEGVCQHPVSCDDDETCTLDSCDGNGICQHDDFPGATCDDGDPCVENVCVDGTCESTDVDVPVGLPPLSEAFEFPTWQAWTLPEVDDDAYGWRVEIVDGAPAGPHALRYGLPEDAEDAGPATASTVQTPVFTVVDALQTDLEVDVWAQLRAEDDVDHFEIRAVSCDDAEPPVCALVGDGPILTKADLAMGEWQRISPDITGLQGQTFRLEIHLDPVDGGGDTPPEVRVDTVQVATTCVCPTAPTCEGSKLPTDDDGDSCDDGCVCPAPPVCDGVLMPADINADGCHDACLCPWPSDCGEGLIHTDSDGDGCHDSCDCAPAPDCGDDDLMLDSSGNGCHDSCACPEPPTCEGILVPTDTTGDGCSDGCGCPDPPECPGAMVLTDSNGDTCDDACVCPAPVTCEGALVAADTTGDGCLQSCVCPDAPACVGAQQPVDASGDGCDDSCACPDPPACEGLLVASDTIGDGCPDSCVCPELLCDANLEAVDSDGDGCDDGCVCVEAPCPAGYGCEGQCGIEGNTLSGCDCTADCLGSNTCCVDYASACDLTCADNCDSSPNPENTCYCDEECTGYGDCCPDYEAICLAPPVWVPSIQDVMKAIYCMVGLGSCDDLKPGAEPGWVPSIQDIMQWVYCMVGSGPCEDL